MKSRKKEKIQTIEIKKAKEQKKENDIETACTSDEIGNLQYPQGTEVPA